MDFSNFKFEVLDITTNLDPDMFVSPSGVTFSKKVVSDLGYPAYVQFSLDKENGYLAVRVCKGSEMRATKFSKPAKEQTGTVQFKGAAFRSILQELIPDYNPKKRYKIVGQLEQESNIMYFDMNAAEITSAYGKY